jgi:hypothetical protein
MKKASGFKMKNPSIAKLAKAAGSNRVAMKMKMEEKAAAAKLKKQSAMKQDPTKIGTKESLTKPKKRSFDEAYEKRDMKLYGGLNKEDYIKEAKRQKAVKESKVLKKGGTYDIPKKPMISKTAGAVVSPGTTKVPKSTTTTTTKAGTKKSNVMKGKKTLGQTKLGNLKVGKGGKRLADTKVGKAFSTARAKGVAKREARAKRMAEAKANRRARREANRK